METIGSLLPWRFYGDRFRLPGFRACRAKSPQGCRLDVITAERKGIIGTTTSLATSASTYIAQVTKKSTWRGTCAEFGSPAIPRQLFWYQKLTNPKAGDHLILSARASV